MSMLESPPTIEPTSTWLADRRAHVVREVELGSSAKTQWRPGRRLVLVAIVVILLVTGVAFAANSFGLLDWLQSSRPGEARFSVDSSRRVSWPAPESLVCRQPGEGEFECLEGARGPWVYDFYNRVAAVPALTREFLLDRLDRAEADGLDPARAARIREAIAAVEDDFFARLSAFTVTTIADPHEVRPGVFLVPPEGVPQFVTCEPKDVGSFSCSALAASVDVPAGAPIYGLTENARWVEQANPAEGYEPLLAENLFGRELTPAELRLLVLIFTVGEGSGEGGSSEVDPPRR